MIIIIIINVVGNNEVVRCDDAGAFQFVFVKAGSVAIVILRDGSLSVLQPGILYSTIYCTSSINVKLRLLSVFYVKLRV